MPTPVRQASFIGGEIAPGLFARTNLERYAESLRLCRNMIPRQEGPVTNRPGLLYKGPANADTGVGRIKEFVFSSGSLSRAFVLEFTAGHIRVWKDGARLAADVATTYTDEEIPRLKFTQLGQILTVFCKQKVPQEVTWVNDDTWTIAPRVITRAIAAPTGLAFVVAPPANELQAAKLWEVVVTAVKADTKEESLPSNVINASMAISSNTPASYQWNAVPGASEYNVYRGRNGKLGYVGTSVGREIFFDDGAYPVYAQVPPSQRDPFPGNDDQPQVGTYHDQRMMVANAWNNPGEVEGSRIGEPKNFDRAAPPTMTDAVTFNIASNQYEEIRHMISWGRNLLILTNAMEQLVTGSEGVIAQDDLVFDDVPTRWGCSWLDPLVIGNSVIFQQDVGATIRDLPPLNKPESNDLTLVGRHLFINHKIVSWCYAHEPFRVIWAVRDDGALLSCTYVKELGLWAWARHDTGTDLFESICSVPSATESVVYALVKRYVDGAWRRYFERLAPRVGVPWREAVFLDSAVQIQGFAGPTFNGLGHLVGREVYALDNGIVRGQFTVQPDGSITLPVGPPRTVTVGLRVTAQGHTLDMYSSSEEIRPKKKIVKKVHMEVEDSLPFKAGQSFSYVLRNAVHPDGLPWTEPRTGLVHVNIDTDWDDQGAVVWEHTDPTPLTILSIIREGDFGGS